MDFGVNDVHAACHGFHSHLVSLWEMKSDTAQGSALCPTLLGEDVESRVLTHERIWLCKDKQAEFQLYNMTLLYTF